MRPIRVLLADPQTLFREGLKALFAECRAVDVVGDVDLPQAVAARMDSASPDVVLMEVDRVASRAVQSARPQTRVVFLTNRQDDEALVDYRQSGAAGYILKDIGVSDFIGAIQSIHEGSSWVSTAVADRVPGGTAKGRNGVLTAREQEVLKMTAEGMSVKEVAVSLDLSAKTVDAHKVNLMRKLRIHNKAQLVQYAYQNQILKLEYQAWR